MANGKNCKFVPFFLINFLLPSSFWEINLIKYRLCLYKRIYCSNTQLRDFDSIGSNFLSVCYRPATEERIFHTVVLLRKVILPSRQPYPWTSKPLIHKARQERIINGVTARDNYTSIRIEYKRSSKWFINKTAHITL